MIASEGEAQAWLRGQPGCDARVWQVFEQLIGLLTAENGRQNLVAANSLAQVWQRHIVDSAQLLAHVPRETSPWLDLGSGAGFPGLVIAALRPACEVWLIESRSLRSEWLARASRTLGLENVRVIAGRVEDVPATVAGAITARAFAPLARLLDLSARFSTSATLWVLPKGRSAQQELQSLGGWNHMFHVEQSLTDPQAGIIVGTLAGRKR
jgi:16S rRNA (guanine527-N7)-methyltransferase